jgi:hypothetical protein
VRNTGYCILSGFLTPESTDLVSIFHNRCNPDQFCWKICLIQKSKLLTHSKITILISLNHFRETERDWDKDLAEDVKGECENKYGPVTTIKVEKETQVSTTWCFPDYSLKSSTVGRNICQIWHRWKRKKGHSRFKWSMVWRKTSLSSFHFWRHYASTSVGYSHGSGAGMHEETPTEMSFFFV